MVRDLSLKVPLHSGIIFNCRTYFQLAKDCQSNHELFLVNFTGSLWNLLLAIYLCFCYGCVPVFSELQSARTVGKGNVELTPSFSSIDIVDEGDHDELQHQLGLQVAYGVTSRFDVRMRYEYIWFYDQSVNDKGTHVLGIGPKYSLLENYIAVAMPVGTAFGEDSDELWELHPTLLLTWPVLKNKIDVNASSKYMITFCGTCDDPIAINLGLSLSTNVTRWSIRPEYGILFIPGDEGYFSQFSLGFSAIITSKPD